MTRIFSQVETHIYPIVEKPKFEDMRTMTIDLTIQYMLKYIDWFKYYHNFKFHN